MPGAPASTFPALELSNPFLVVALQPCPQNAEGIAGQVCRCLEGFFRAPATVRCCACLNLHQSFALPTVQSVLAQNSSTHRATHFGCKACPANGADCA
jgi:hypothetical protein